MSSYLHTPGQSRGETVSVTRPENWVNPITGLEATVKKGVLPLPGVKLILLSRPAHTEPSRLPLSSYYYMAIRSTSIHFRAMASPISFLQNFLFLVATFQFCISKESTASLQTACSHLLLGFPTCLIRPKYPLPLYGPARRTFFGLRNVDSATKSYNLYISHCNQVSTSPCPAQNRTFF